MGHDGHGLANLTIREQFGAGRLGRRLSQLIGGLWLFGVAAGLIVRARLGQAPWDVLHYGVALHVPVSIGAVSILTGAVVLLLWIPLRQRPGLGTILNVLLIGVAMDVTMAVVPDVTGVGAQLAVLASALVLNGLGSALYLGSQFGTGPRDGLMTGIARRTGRSLRLVRSGIEVTVLLIGWLLGGQVGLGTVAYALLIGPLTQFFLPRVVVRLPVRP